jgi:hypothetical protein
MTKFAPSTRAKLERAGWVERRDVGSRIEEWAAELGRGLYLSTAAKSALRGLGDLGFANVVQGLGSPWNHSRSILR